MSKLKKLPGHIILGLNILVILGMLCTGYSYLIDPEVHPSVGFWSLLFPVFLVLNFLFLLIWLIFSVKKAIVPFVALLICFPPIHMYIGMNPAGKVEQGSIKVMSYNVLSFAGMPEEKLDRNDNALVRYLIDSDCDIICLQESFECLSDSMKDILHTKYPNYQLSVHKTGANSIYSKYEILSSDSIIYESKGNSTSVYTLKTPFGKVLVINNHLESNALSPTDKAQFKSIVKGEVAEDSIKGESKNILSKLNIAAAKRSPQAKAVAEYIAKHKGEKILVCGDFNDNPLSFAHHTIEGGLTDCFTSAGLGLGWSYCHSGIRVRIDNIMCSEQFTPLQCKVDDKVRYSDHFPIVCWLKLSNKGAEK